MPIQDEYRPGRDSLVESFFKPVLGNADTYWRAAGYFSSSVFELIDEPLRDFVQRGGPIRLVTSVELYEEDIEAIKTGLSRRDAMEKRLLEVIEDEDWSDGRSGRETLAWLVEHGRIEIRVAVTDTGRGIYHEKVGILFDGPDFIAFAGSSNESRSALEENYECVDVFRSWAESRRAALKKDHFEALWANRAPKVDVFEFPEAARRQLLRARARGSFNQPGGGATAEVDVATPSVAKWRHQEDALRLFLAAERGVLNMATGTGKTRTAIKIMRRLAAEAAIRNVVIATKGDDLLDQWYRAILSSRSEWPIAPRIYRHYDTHREATNFELDDGPSVLLVSRYFLPRVLKAIPGGRGREMILVHDEVHGLGSPRNRQELAGLSDGVRYRLGLSATPERDYDEEGNEFIDSNVGPVIFTFGLEDAIRRGILAPFVYYPLEYVPSAEDRQRVADVFKKQAARQRAGTPMAQEEVYIEIARVYKTSKEKIPAFVEFLRRRPELLERSIIFAETVDYARDILEVVHEYRPDFHTYFSGEDAETLARFARGDLECLVACHRLSEGIDVQSLRTVVLFSSSRARLETTQRIGRCLRVDPGNLGKVANVVDFVRVTDGEDNPDQERKDWLSILSTVRPEEVTD